MHPCPSLTSLCGLGLPRSTSEVGGIINTQHGTLGSVPGTQLLLLFRLKPRESRTGWIQIGEAIERKENNETRKQTISKALADSVILLMCLSLISLKILNYLQGMLVCSFNSR